MIYNILGDPAVGRADLSRVRHLHYGAAPMAPERIRQALDVFHGGLEVIYGQTEAPMLITGMTAAEFRDERNLRSVGRETLLMRTAIMGEDGELLPPGEVGEIVCRGDLLMTGYLDMPEATAETLVDGWLHTGDAGEMDERGYLFIRDRLRDVIISGGFNVYPSDVEATVVQHPAVHDCIVFGVADGKWGERVEVAVQVNPGAVFDADDLRAFVKARIGSVKTPKRVHVADELPKSGVGKVLRREAQRLFGGA
jgi:fatty-acyl-CoA synthase